MTIYKQTDYCPGGEIFSYLRKARRFPESTTRFYAAEITLALQYLHSAHNIAYRDLKPENILLDERGHIKLVDFGFAKSLDPKNDRLSYTLCGTPEYLAPEVIQNTGHGLAVDWWALGILIYEFLVGHPPFWDNGNQMRVYEQIVHGRVQFPRETTCSYAARNIVMGLCKTNPTERLGYICGGSKRIQMHPFFDGVDWDALDHVPGPIVPRVDHPADAANFDAYPDPPQALSAYTREMRHKYEGLFADF